MRFETRAIHAGPGAHCVVDNNVRHAIPAIGARALG